MSRQKTIATPPNQPSNHVEMSSEELAEFEAEQTKNLQEQQANEYKMLRQKAYIDKFGDVEDQLDFIYHNSLDAWKAEIKKIKDQYPKE